MSLLFYVGKRRYRVQNYNNFAIYTNLFLFFYMKCPTLVEIGDVRADDIDGSGTV